MSTHPSPVALVTGASSGMGKDFALRLLEEGYAVYGAARRVERIDSGKAETTYLWGRGNRLAGSSEARAAE